METGFFWSSPSLYRTPKPQGKGKRECNMQGWCLDFHAS